MTDHTGHFGWHDMNAHDASASGSFYRGLFGWSIAEKPFANGYRALSDVEGEFGGIFPMPEEMEAPTSWIGYLLVNDLEDITGRAPSLGGWYPFGEMPVPGMGRFSIIFDPTGAPVTAFEPASGTVFDNLGTGGTGNTVLWNELLTTDIASSASFHRDLYGWEFDDGPYAPGHYLVARVDGIPVAGLFQPEPGPQQSVWIRYFATTDAEALADRATELGATVIHKPTGVPGIGITAWLNDPHGATFGLMQPAEGWFDRLRQPTEKEQTT